MSLPLDILHEICFHCDAPTYVNLCLTSKNLYSYEKEHLFKMEFFSFVEKLKFKNWEMTYTDSHHTKLKIAHQVMRIIMSYLHILKLPEQKNNLYTIITKLREFEEHGMSKRKVEQYRKKLIEYF